MIARPEILTEKNEDDQPIEGDIILIDPKIPNNKLPNIDFSKQVSREGLETVENIR
jgi:hypothetical protein